MKNENIWAKTLLCVYRYLERVAGAVDKIMLRKALSSGSVTSLTFSSLSSERVSGEMIDLMERKVTMINLKVLVEDCLEGMREKDASLLIDKFVSGLKSTELIEKHNISMRSVFRKIDLALSSFQKQLSLRGYDDEKIEEMTQKEAWIQNAHNRFLKNEEDVVLSDIALERAVR